MKKVAVERLKKRLFWDNSLDLVLGCSPAKSGCAHCWKAKLTHRMGANPVLNGRYSGLTTCAGGGRWNGVIKPNPRAFDACRRGSDSTRVYLVLTDMFHDGLTNDEIKMFVEKFGAFSRHVFIVLTKRERNASDVLSNYRPLDNVYIGVTCSDQEELEFAAAYIKKVKRLGWHTGLSLEPLLGPVDLKKCFDTGVIEFVLAGGENGTRARVCTYGMARSVVDSCAAIGAPLFWKGAGDNNMISLDRKEELLRNSSLPWMDQFVEGRRP